MDMQLIVINKITTVLIDLTQSNNISWYVFLFVCAPGAGRGGCEQPWRTFEQLFVIIINAIINTSGENMKKCASLKQWTKDTRM
jgi:hypothetical protein